MPRPPRIAAALAGILSSHDRHDWSLEDLQAALTAGGVQADFSSVFRAVCRLEGEGRVRRLQIGTDRARYEAVGPHHEHVRCRGCGSVAQVPCRVPDELVAQAGSATGYRITGHALILTGECPTCAGTGSV